ncbi:MAG: DUF5714 domain-containing protein [Thermodesulfobacteriota bacterium]|nr:DUF5714 domain-containing protein [Thermodesulfobacteriota bacterium]
MKFQIDRWQRFQYRDIPIYFNLDEPDWFVPNQAGDDILQSLYSNKTDTANLNIIRFLDRLPVTKPTNYQGRSAYLQLNQLKELWFHITNQCNLSCSHCLFASSPKDESMLRYDKIMEMAKEAHFLGCCVFAITGGEPLVHPDIEQIINGLFQLNNCHVVILTNGMNLPAVLDRNQFDFNRLHFQISMDGIGETHDNVRGKGTFHKLAKKLKWIRERKIPYTLAMCVSRQNVKQMPDMVDFAASVGAGNVHFMWYFIRGRGQKENFAVVETIFHNLTNASELADTCGIKIDNLESLRTQIFAPRGTIHDGTTAAWESLAIGPDGLLYPSAALIGIPELSTDPSTGIEKAWHQSPVLQKIRKSTAASLASPFRFLLGGGDIDHSYTHKKTFCGDDPYQRLQEKLVLWLIAGEINRQLENDFPQIRLRMGEILESCGAHGKVAFTHSNCLLATAQENSLTIVKSFYSEAVGDKREDILNPVCYDENLIDHIPEAYRFRGYGCGSPVLDADIQKGEHVVDLGCGSGVECFIAARLTGRTGKVIGVDMLDPMLQSANEALEGVIKNMGFNNIQFKKGYLEELPMENDSVDLVLSNCVMNLSVHKRRSYAEIYRILRPGGRLVISDVVCESDPDPAIRNDEILRGECIAGAMAQGHLMALLQETGFKSIRMINRFPYRTVQGHPFFSLTFSAVKPKVSKKVKVIYRGPSWSLITHDGILLPLGEPRFLDEHEVELLDDQVFVIDGSGTVTNIEAENTCSCFLAPEKQEKKSPASNPMAFVQPFRHKSGCMVCGSSIVYLSKEKECQCAYCGMTFSVNSMCEKGHHVCDACHAEDGFKVIRHICTNTAETDMIRLLEQIRQHPSIPVNGPEHHALVPGIILATYRNITGDISASTIETGIERGRSVAGGYCAFMGICGAAVGVGIAFSLILDANPLEPEKRKVVQSTTQTVLAEIAKLRAARCCQRDSWIALKKAASLSEVYLPVSFHAESDLVCMQKQQNEECLGRGCPLY